METEMSSYRRFLKKKRLSRDNLHLLCFGCGKHTGKTCKHPLEADNFAFEMTKACSSEPINSRWSTLGRDPRLSIQPAFLQHSLQRRVERTLFYLEQVIGDLLDVLHQRIAMHGLQSQRLENHDLQCAGEKVAMFRVLRHSLNYMTTIPILKIAILR